MLTVLEYAVDCYRQWACGLPMTAPASELNCEWTIDSRRSAGAHKKPDLQPLFDTTLFFPISNASILMASTGISPCLIEELQAVEAPRWSSCSACCMLSLTGLRLD
ncbi:hypothetical protein PsorP6_004815 [Peronosclerospora sorghi]|uniref:Uncharacterized protein n=1 Tax=Peronosclerospora sorghi TaxID=230839 RepID=A0ACC0VNP8_9STRA|nr:hypothetical protein PsorP6_004815 [Peronosclerospora sorghi]